MASLTGSAWRRIAPQVRQRIRERLDDTPQLLHTRIPLPYVVGIGVGLFLLPYVLWWLTATSRGPASPRMADGIELQQLVTALQSTLAEPVVGHVPTEAPAPFAPRDVEVELHFVVQRNIPTRDASLYRLVPVDTALQTRPEHVQTLKMRLLPILSQPTQVVAPESATAAPRATEELGLRKPAPVKKRDRS